jgi:hypothetical protein
VRKEAQALGPAVRERQLPKAGVLGDRLRDGLVEAPVERPELVGRDRGLEFDGQLRHGLAHVPVVMDDLGHGEAGLPQLAAVPDGALRHLAAGRKLRRLLLAAQRIRELREEEGHPVLQLLCRGMGGIPRADLRTRARDDLGAVQRQEFVEHARLQDCIFYTKAKPRFCSIVDTLALAGR